ncbi:MAG: serine hydrolase, partial [Cyanobium sp. MAG06]|nr:serine hydrolase [Cyanobium sp. MAG06]
ETNNNKLAIASITKLLTALTVYKLAEKKKIDLNKVNIKITQSAKNNSMFNNKKTETGKVKVGDVYPLTEAIGAMLINSTNSLAETIAETLVDRGEFLKEMNTIAKQIGMNDSNFSSPSGLNINNTSTASDITKLLLAAYNSEYKIGD